jgi:hydroxymethylbilane synthase
MIALNRPVVLASRGSALAVAQSKLILDLCRAAFPQQTFELRTYKTTGDKLQTAPPDRPALPGTKGLFTKELEAALLSGEADLAVHSLKDLPTELPDGLKLGAVSKRADVRDVLVYRDVEFLARAPALTPRRGLHAHSGLRDFPSSPTVGTSSTRRQAQLAVLRADVKCVPIRGNVGTRLRKLAEQAELDAIILAAAGFERLGIKILPNGQVQGDGVPDGLVGVYLSPEEMLPCAGQAALGIESRSKDRPADEICAALNDYETHQCVLAERAFLQAMGGGCLSPVAALGDVYDRQLRLRAVSFQNGRMRRGELRDSIKSAAALGKRLAENLK